MVDVFREPHDGDTWICRRDASIRMRYEKLIRNDAAAPYLRPEVVLLFKAKHARAKDDEDFRRTVPLLDAAARQWLAAAVARCHYGHRWLRRLTPK